VGGLGGHRRRRRRRGKGEEKMGEEATGQREVAGGSVLANGKDTKSAQAGGANEKASRHPYYSAGWGAATVHSRGNKAIYFQSRCLW
jgi:hypothetical protein